MSDTGSALETRRRLNLVVVGKSGVGKSSLLNYAAGRHVFDTGTGDPVTSEYFESVDVPGTAPGIAFSLYDTKGIENDRTDEWYNTILAEIRRRDQSDSIYDWFHTIIYCISAGDRRIEPFDIQAIRRLMQIGSVIVVFTKKDQVSPAELKALEEKITVELGSRIQVFAVCNGATTRGGTMPPSGLDAVLRGSFIGLWEKAAKVVPQRAMHAATATTQRFVMPRTLSGAIATMALSAVVGYIFPDAYCLLRILDEPFQNYSKIRNRRLIPIDYFEIIAEHAPITVSGDDDDDLVDISYAADATRTFFMPSCLGRGELKRNYYRKAIIAWAHRWATTIDDFYTNIIDGTMQQRFQQYVDHTINEILRFYNDLTHSEKQRLVQNRTTEIIESIPEVIKTHEYRRHLTAGARNIGEEMEKLDRSFFATDHRRQTLEWQFMALAADAARASNEFSAAMFRATEALETELRAYGQYFLRDNNAGEHDSDAILQNLRRLAADGNHDRIIEILKDPR